MVTGNERMPPKIMDLLRSGQKESYDLAMIILQKEYPAVWAAMLNFTVDLSTFSDLTARSKMIEEIYKNSYINIGTKVKYRGMNQCPPMVVTTIGVNNFKGFGNTIIISTVITAKYYNKSSQSFTTVNDRIECFEIIRDEEDKGNATVK